MLSIIYLVNFYFSFIVCIFQGFSLAFQVRLIPLSSHFAWLSLSIWNCEKKKVKNKKQKPYCGLEGVCIHGKVPQQPECAQWLWWQSWIYCEHKSHLDQYILAAVILVGSRVGDEEARASCELEFLLCWWLSLPYWECERVLSP